jgi:hypothetical protein
MTQLGTSSSERQRWGLVTFAGGDRRWTWAARRLARQAEQSRMFASIRIHSAADLGSNHQRFFKEHVEPWSKCRGFGFWVWKPFIIREELRTRRQDLDGVMYLDAGHELNLTSTRARERLREYWASTLDGMGLLAPSLPGHPEFSWTRKAVMWQLDPSGRNHDTDQVQAHPMLRVDAESCDLVDEWVSLCLQDDHFLLHDPAPGEDLDARFVAHRHDQSIFSLLVKNLGYVGPADETYHHPNWTEAGKEFPIWAARNRSGVSVAKTGRLGGLQRSIERLGTKLL